MKIKKEQKETLQHLVEGLFKSLNKLNKYLSEEVSEETTIAPLADSPDESELSTSSVAEETPQDVVTETSTEDAPAEEPIITKETSSNPRIDGYARAIPFSHTENDAVGGAWQLWSESSFEDFIAVVRPQIEGMHSAGIPFDIGCTYDFIQWATGKTVDGASFFQWLIEHNVNLSTRAHEVSKSNAADAAYLLEQQGIPHTGILASCDDLNDIMDEHGNSKPLFGKIHKTASYKYDIVMGVSFKNAEGIGTHQGQTTFPAGIYRPVPGGNVVVLELGRTTSASGFESMFKAVKSGMIKTGVASLMCNMGRSKQYAEKLANLESTPNAGPCDYMSTSSGNHTSGDGGIYGNWTGGHLYWSELQNVLSRISAYIDVAVFSSARALVTDWVAAGEPSISYNAEDLKFTEATQSARAETSIKPKRGKIKDLNTSNKTFTLVQGVKDHSSEKLFVCTYSEETAWLANGVASSDIDFVNYTSRPLMCEIEATPDQVDGVAVFKDVTSVKNVQAIE